MEKYKKTIGRFGEDLAADFLLKRGYAIIDRNIKIGHGEIDLIASKQSELVFVEVKTIASQKMGPADEALKHRQIKILKKTISCYCQINRLNQLKTRLDFISVDIDRLRKTAKIRHYKNIT
jgi:putative endonuclease